MNKITIGLIAVVIAIGVGFGLFYLYGAGVRDKAVTKQETVKEAWGNVQSAYQRRADLIGNLVETVKGAANTEKEILIGVTSARAGLVQYVDSVGNVVAAGKSAIGNASTPNQLEQADMMIMNGYRGMRGFLTENYPDLKSISNFATLQSQLEGTENRINTERNRYNESVKDYNSLIRGTFKRIGLKLVGSEEDDFTMRESFQAKPGAEDAPQVKF